ncbi:hypothetical protein [Dactylosporangium sp. NPDC005555]|uniref:hypothetical protein n=1 Tax=Dactylosporangium sp. NPDC005555 TaxID=3154889 RepID=UPI0033B96614
MQPPFDVRTLPAYAWVFDLAAEDDEVRAAALRRTETLLWRPHVSVPTGTLADPLAAFTAPDTDLGGDELRRLEPYALLFMRWSRRFPAECRRVWRLWPSGFSWPVAAFIRHGVSDATRAALEDLVLDAVHRTGGMRQDPRLARFLDGAALRDRLRAAGAPGATAGPPGQAVRLRAGYLLWLVEHPGECMTARSWRRWRRTHGVPVTHPRPAPDLAALPAAVAAAELAGLETPDLAAVFEAIEPAPAARIAAAMVAGSPAAETLVSATVAPGGPTRPAAVSAVAAAMAAMDARTAAWMCNSMPEPLAAGVLAAMPPAAAADRFPRPKRDRVLLLMSEGDAVARLSAMSPLRAAQQLRWRPADVAARLLTAMDPGTAAAALARVRSGWGPGRILAALPAGLAGGLVERMPPGDQDRLRWIIETERFEAAARAAVAASSGDGEHQDRHPG